MGRTCCQDNGLTFVHGSVCGRYAKAVFVFRDTGDILDGRFRALAHRLLEKLVAELVSAYRIKARDVLDFRGIDDLSAENGLLDHHYCLCVSSAVNSGGETRRSPADYNNIVHITLL